MWDTHNHHHKTEFVDRNISIVEQRAPTDESVALLKEMQEKIQENFLGSFPLPNNLFNATVNVCIDASQYNVLFYVQYKINYEVRRLKIQIPMQELSNIDFSKAHFNADSDRDQYLTKLICKEISADFAKLFYTFMYPGPLNFAPTLVMANADDPQGKKSSERAVIRDMFTFRDGITREGMSMNEDEDVKNKFEYIEKWTNTHSTHSHKLIEKIKDLWWYE